MAVVGLNFGKPKFSQIRGWAAGPFSLLNVGKAKLSEIRGRAVGAVVFPNLGIRTYQNLAKKGLAGRSGPLMR